ncbi:DUF397 domain-containing protein [Streptomyces sp. NPDC020951]|uniref:DUF397 domain-containing protein n=1 Tax=Streptomyces sp. NPDC020951 TaxID=3365104 RepID=UPI0037AECE0C
MTTPENWQKSSFSGFGDGDECLELASTPAALHLRESDHPAAVLTAPPALLAHLLHSIRTEAPGIVASTTARPRRPC